MEPRRYKVESRPIIDLVRDIRAGRLIMAAYFQRELVWRDTHKKDFIDTILSGFPFPLIFVSRGRIDVERMQATSLLVDGQQRISTIVEYVGDGFAVDGLKFSELPINQREQFLKYEVPVIDLDFSEDDPRILEVFKRLNRTFYSLTEIERMSTEYASSEFMLIAKFFAGQFQRGLQSTDDDAASSDELDSEEGEDGDATTGVQASQQSSDFRHISPDIPADFWQWAARVKADQTHRLLLKAGVFTPYETSRQVHLMFALNLLSTIIDGGFFSRNEKVRTYLEKFRESVPNRDQIAAGIELSASHINRANFSSKSYWKTKANTFSLMVCLFRNREKLSALPPAKMREKLDDFARELPSEYQLAAKEAVNRRRERTLRDEFLTKTLFSST